MRKLQLSENLQRVEERIEKAASSAGRSRNDISLIVVSKTFPVSDAQLLYDIGVRNFGENRDEEGSVKAPLLPSDAHWHFQGQIQSRKISSICTWATVVHSLDSLSHAQKFSTREKLPEKFFIQISLDAAEHRGGVTADSLSDFISELPSSISFLVTGLMVVPPLSFKPGKAFEDVAKLAQRFNFKELSMGMSGDFEEAIRYGATHIRVGSSILGSRSELA